MKSPLQKEPQKDFDVKTRQKKRALKTTKNTVADEAKTTKRKGAWRFLLLLPSIAVQPKF